MTDDHAADGSGTEAGALADRVRAGDLKLYELEAHADHDTAARARRLVVERETDADLGTVGDYAFPAATADANVENFVGAVQIPLGVAGPIPVEGASAGGSYYLPLATTEGALVAGVNRGCAAIRAAGGATARTFGNAMTRAPVFRVDDVAEAEAVAAWVDDHREVLAETAEATTSHGELLEAAPYVVGDSVFVRFAYDTKDAMGMNLATIATEAAAEIVVEETPADLVALSGNLCADKKPAAINAVEGRGRTAAADVRLSRETVADVLNTTPEAIAEVNARKNYAGSAKAASLGFNAQAANVVAAAFLATGQDAAQVVEGASAITTAERRDGDLYLGVTLASLELGTVGGGTTLPTQQEALSALGVAGGGDPPGANADALAEVVAAAVLAGELNLLSALASNNLADAHADLGR